jgi:glycosyltransferase involved in cell wall biosynthesis
MKNFSVVIITYNEEANIGRCLESLIGLTDDIVVVDSGSEDKTAEICKSYNVRFLVNKFEDYSTQKNLANTTAKYDYIFSIDADECLSEELKKSIASLDFNADNLAFSMNRLNHHRGKKVRFGGWYPDKKIRIWNKKFGGWKGEIHEWIEFWEKPTVKHLAGDLLHYTYTSKEQHIRQAEKFSRLNAQNDFKQNKKSNHLKLICATAFRFFSVYFLKFGIFDGKTGFFIAKTTAHATFLRNRELIHLNKKKMLKKIEILKK